jgi:hypothetical protein
MGLFQISEAYGFEHNGIKYGMWATKSEAKREYAYHRATDAMFDGMTAREAAELHGVDQAILACRVHG